MVKSEENKQNFLNFPTPLQLRTRLERENRTMDLLQHLDLPSLSDSSDTDDFLQELAALNDAGLLRATMESLECGRLTPLIKEELRCRIQSRRLSEGKEELLVEFPSPTPSQPRPDEVQKRDRRREQNRRAAQKFRKKKKERGEHLIEETQRLENHNTSLRSEIKQLHEEREQLTRIIRSHASVCPLTPRQSPLTIIRESPLPGSIRGSPLTLPLTSASLLARSPVMGKSPVLGKSPVMGKSPIMSKSPVVLQSPVLLVPPTRESPVPLLIINSARESPIPGRVVPSSPVPMSGRPRKSPVSMLRINQSPIPGDKLGHKSPILFGSPPKQSKHSIPPRLNLAGPKPVVPILPKPAANSSPSPKTPMGLIMSPLAPSPVSVGGRALHMSPVFFGEGCFTPSSRARQISQSPISVTDSSSNSTPPRITQQSPVFFGERAPSTAHAVPHFLQPLSASSTSSTSSLASMLRQESPLSVLSNSSSVSNVSSIFISNSQNANNQLDNNSFMDNISNNNNNIVSNNNINNNSICNNNDNSHNNSISNRFDPPNTFQPKSPSVFSCSPNSSSRDHPDDNVLCLEDIERSATGYEARDDLIDFIDIQALLELSGDQNGNNQGDHSRAQREGTQGAHGANLARNNFASHDIGHVEDSLMESSTNPNRDIGFNQVDESGHETCRSMKTMSSPGFGRQVKSQGVADIAQTLLAIAQNLPNIAQNSNSFGGRDNDPSIIRGPTTTGQQGGVFEMDTTNVCRDLNSGKETNSGFYQSPFGGHQESAFRGTSVDHAGSALRDYTKFSHESIMSPASLASLHSSLRELLAAQNARMAREQSESHANSSSQGDSSIHVVTDHHGQQSITNNENDLPDGNSRCLSSGGFGQIGSEEHACSNDNSDSDYTNLQSSFSLDMLMTSHSICSTNSESRFSQASHQYS